MNVLREYRHKKHLTQVQLAELLGCSQSLVTHIECGRRRPTAEQAAEWDKRTRGALSKRDLRPDLFVDELSRGRRKSKVEPRGRPTP